MLWWFEDLADEILTWDQIYLKAIKSSWTSIALRMTELWPSQWFTIGLPAKRKFNFTFGPTIKDWYVQVEPSELYQKSLCKYRNELTLYLTIMVVSIGFMSSSHSPLTPRCTHTVPTLGRDPWSQLPKRRRCPLEDCSLVALRLGNWCSHAFDILGNAAQIL